MLNITPTQKLYALIYYIRTVTGNTKYNGYLNRVYESKNIELIVDNLVSDMLNEVEGLRKATVDTGKIKQDVIRQVHTMLQSLSSPEYGESGFNFLPTSAREMIYSHTKHLIKNAIANQRPRRFVSDLEYKDYELAGKFISIFKTKECPHDNITDASFKNNFAEYYESREQYTKELVKNKQDISSLKKLSDRIAGTFHSKKIAESIEDTSAKPKTSTSIELWVPSAQYATFKSILEHYSNLFCDGEPVAETTTTDTKGNTFKTFTLTESQYKSFFSKFFITFTFRKDFELNTEDNKNEDGKGSSIDNIVYEEQDDHEDSSNEESTSIPTNNVSIANNDRLFIACALNSDIPTTLEGGSNGIIQANKYFYKEVCNADYDTLDDLIDVLNNQPIDENSPVYKNIQNIESMIDTYESEGEDEVDEYNKLLHMVYTFTKFLHQIVINKYNNRGNLIVKLPNGSSVNLDNALNAIIPHVLNGKVLNLPTFELPEFIQANNLNNANAEDKINAMNWISIAKYPKIIEKYINPEIRNLNYRLSPTGAWEKNPNNTTIEDLPKQLPDAQYNSVGTLIDFIKHTRDKLDKYNHKLDLLNALTFRLASETGSQSLANTQFDAPTFTEAEVNSIAASAEDKMKLDRYMDANKVAKAFFNATLENKYRTIINDAQKSFKDALKSAGLLNKETEKQIQSDLLKDFRGNDATDLQLMLGPIFNTATKSESDMAFNENSIKLTQLATLIYYSNILYNTVCEINSPAPITFADVMKSHNYNELIVDMMYKAVKTLYDNKYMQTSDELSTYQDKLNYIKQNLPAITHTPNQSINNAISAIAKTLPTLTEDDINIHDYFSNFIQSRKLVDNINDYAKLSKFKVNPKAMSMLLTNAEEKSSLFDHDIAKAVKELKKKDAEIARLNRKMDMETL